MIFSDIVIQKKIYTIKLKDYLNYQISMYERRTELINGFSILA